MYPEAYKEWIAIFNDDLLKTWQQERKELQKAAMLLTAFQKELKDVQTNLEVQLINLQQQLKYRDDLEEKGKSLPPKNRKNVSPKYANNDKENVDLQTTFLHPLDDTFISTQRDPTMQLKSPDLFKNIDQNIPQPADTSIIDLSISDEDTAVDDSPTIKRRRRYYHRNKIVSIKSKKTDTPVNKGQTGDSVKTNIFKTPSLMSDDDLSVIENTPEVSHRSGVAGTVGGVTLKKMAKCKGHNNTLTQMFGKAKKKLKMDSNKKTEDDVDSDETYFEETTEGTKLGITDMISYINKDETMVNEEIPSTDQRVNDDLTDCELDGDSSQDVDQFSKGAIFNETDVATSDAKPKLNPLEPEPIVRGNARKQLQGWACERCKNFYGHMNLSPEDLKKKMDECSRHRYKYRPIEETLPGFWDLTIPPEEAD